MSVHIQSDLNVKGKLNVDSEIKTLSVAKVAGLHLWDGSSRYAWQLYSTTTKTSLVNDNHGIHFALENGNINMRTSGIVYSSGIHATNAKIIDRLMVNGDASIDGTLYAESLHVSSLAIVSASSGTATFKADNAVIKNKLTANTLDVTENAKVSYATFTEVLDAHAAVVSEMTVLQTLDADRIMASEMTVMQTLTAKTLDVSDTISANIITASFLNVAGSIDAGSLTVDGVPIMSGGSSEGDIPTALTVASVKATKYVEVSGTGAYNGIRLDAESGLQLGMDASITISNPYDAPEDSYVKINVSGVRAQTIHGDTVKGALIQGTTINATDLTAASMLATTLQTDTLQVDDEITSQKLDASILVADQLSANFLNVVNSLQSQPALDGDSAFSIIIGDTNQAALSLKGSAVIDGSLSVTSLKVNGVDITDNGGESELTSTIMVSEVQALSPGAAVSIPQMQGNALRLHGNMEGLSPSEYVPLGLHVRLRREQDVFPIDASSITVITALLAGTEFREPVLFRPENGKTLIKSLDHAGFEQYSVVNTGLNCAPTIAEKANGVIIQPGMIGYSERAWVETRPALINSTLDERAAITLGADRALTQQYNDTVATANGYGASFLNIDSAAFTLTSESITTRAACRLPLDSSQISALYIQNATGTPTTPTDYTPLLYAAEVKTNVSPSLFNVEATATLATYGTITSQSSNFTNYINNTKAEIQLDVSPDAYTREMSYITDNPGSGIYVRPNNVIIQAPFKQSSINVAYDIPAPLNSMGVGLYGRNIVLRAESSIKLNAATSVIGTLHVSGLTKANAVSVVTSLSANYLHVSGSAIVDTLSVVGTLHAKSLYVDGVKITGTSGGGTSGSEFSGQYTGGNIVLGGLTGSDFSGLAQKDDVVVLGCDMNNPNVTTLSSFDTNVDDGAGIRIDNTYVKVKANTHVTLHASSIQFYARNNSTGVYMYTDTLDVYNTESKPAIRLDGNSSLATLLIGEPDSNGGLCLHSLNIATKNMAIKGSSNVKMFDLENGSDGTSIKLSVGTNRYLALSNVSSTNSFINLYAGSDQKLTMGSEANANYSALAAGENSNLTLRSTSTTGSAKLTVGDQTTLELDSDTGFNVDVNANTFISTDAGGNGGWQFGNPGTCTKFYTNYESVVDSWGKEPQTIIDDLITAGAIHACLPLSILMKLFQLKSGPY